MMLADIQQTLGNGFVTVVMVLGFYMWVAKKFMASNPNVKNAAQKAASDKIIGLIGKWVK